MSRTTALLLFFLCLLLPLQAIEHADSTIYQGINLKIDLGNTAYELIRSKAKTQSYEAAINVDLLHRYYPTLDFGYAQSADQSEGGQFFGRGGFVRPGIDISALRKSGPDNKLLVGLRLGTAVQGYNMQGVTVQDPYWQDYTTKDFSTKVKADVWGEVVAGVQVQVYKAFNMGWYARLKILMTRQKDGQPMAYYIPGYGYYNELNFSFNYYIAFKL